jgi:hypothetical protein
MMNKPKSSELYIHSIGTLAADVLSSEKIISVFSPTSRGIYFKFGNNRMIFLSFEDYRGPLTANLAEGSSLLSSLSSGDPAIISGEKIIFSRSGISISKSNAIVWKPPGAIETSLSPADRGIQIRDLALAAYRQKKSDGLSELLPVLVDVSPEYLNKNSQFKKIYGKINKIGTQITQGDMLLLSQTIQSFLGLGGGLTPWGDDFVMGLLLSLNRWRAAFQSVKNLPEFNQQIVDAAYKCTTTLSANLIECATLGLADERLIQAVDLLAAAKYNQFEVLPGILNWGNSSGVDALVGMITAFLSVQPSSVSD